jgi:tetratricopeptide (TPR) repeat protein
MPGYSLPGTGHCVNLICEVEMQKSKTRPLSAVYLFLAASFLLSWGCSHSIPRIGTGGRYLEGKAEVTRGPSGNLDKAIIALESVVRDDPTYNDSLTLLGRAYYGRGRYQDAYHILQRAVVLNREDEIAWLVLGLSELRLNQDEKGLETVKGGLTLLSQATRNGYKRYTNWDANRSVNTALRRTILYAAKGLEEKENLTRSAENLLRRIDDEERAQKGDKRLEKLQERESN